MKTPMDLQMLLSVVQLIGMVVTVSCVILATRAAIDGFQRQLKDLSEVVDKLSETVNELTVEVAVLKARMSISTVCPLKRERHTDADNETGQ